MKVLIWWLTQQDFEAIESMRGKVSLIGNAPAWLYQQYTSANGRAGRGRLWVAAHLDAVSVDPWPSTALAAHCDRCAGIVIEEHMVYFLRDLPGVVTDTNLKRYDLHESVVLARQAIVDAGFAPQTELADAVKSLDDRLTASATFGHETVRRLVDMLREAGVAIPEDLLVRLRKLGGPLSGIEVE